MKYLKIILSVVLFLGISINSYAVSTKSELWSFWVTSNPQSQNVVNNGLYAKFLTKYVYTNADGINFVKYSQVNVIDKEELHNYLIYLSKLKVSDYNKNEQLAYWINLYNALTIYTVLNHMPTTSITKIKLNGIFSSGPWDAKLIKVENEELSLNDIEHRIIRPIWHDSRTHYALNCASISCPNIQKIPFNGQRINQMLNEDAVTYVNSSRAVTIKDHKLILSSIYNWYDTDFARDTRGVIAEISKFAHPSLKQQLVKFNEVDKYEYNWSLNGK